MGSLLCALALAPAAHGQVVVGDEMNELMAAKGMFAGGPRLASAADGERIIRSTLGSSESYGARVLRDIDSKDFHAVIHVLKWADPTSDPGQKVTQTVQAQNWYVFRGGSGWTQTDFTSANRLFGSKGFYLLIIHLNHDPDAGNYLPHYQITITQKQAANVANLLAAAKLLGADFDAFKAQSVTTRRDWWVGRFVPVDDVPSDITIAPAIVARAGSAPAPLGGGQPRGNRETPTPNNPFQDILKQPPPAGPAQTPTPATGDKPAPPQTPPHAPVAETAPAPMAAPAPASAPQTDAAKQIAVLREQLAALEKQVTDMKNQAALQSAPQSLGDARKFDNEGKYWWDVSIGVPVRKVNDFQRTAAGLDVKTVSKNTAFALVNLFFKPVDLKTPTLNTLPHALVGVGLEKRPLDRFFIGGGWGPVYANFFAGVAFKRVEAQGKTTYPREVTFGVNVPVLTITKRLAEQEK